MLGATRVLQKFVSPWHSKSSVCVAGYHTVWPRYCLTNVVITRDQHDVRKCSVAVTESAQQLVWECVCQCVCVCVSAGGRGAVKDVE